MESLISVITLYDIISMTLPGSLIFCSALLFFREFIDVNLIINHILFNNAFITVSLFVFICYCIGWVNSQIAKFSIWSFLDNIFFRSVKEDEIFNFEKCFFKKICFFSLVFLCVTICFFRFSLEGILKCIILLIILLIVFYPFPKEKNKNNNTQLEEKCKNAYNKYFEHYSNEPINIEWTVCYALIQTNSRYNRIHNYNASKSFSKNLGTACVLVSFTSIYFLLTYSMVTAIPSIFIGIACAISSRLMKSRYRFFENRVNELTAIYFIDYVKNR